MWLILVGLSLLAGDVLSQARNIIDSETDLLAEPSDQLIHSSAELLGIEDRLSDYPFGARLPGYEKPLFAYSYTVGSDKENTKPVTVQTLRTSKSGGLKGAVGTESTKNVIYLSNLHLPGKNNDPEVDDSNEEETPSFNLQKKFSDEDSRLRGDLPNQQQPETEYLPPNVRTEYLLPENRFELLPPTEIPREVSDYLPPNEISDPPREFTEYLPPNQLSDPPRELSEYLPPKEVADPPRELSEYLPPNELADPHRELSKYLVPKEFADPPKEFADPPKEFADPPKEFADPPEELSEYLPPKEVDDPPRELTEYLPPNAASDPTKVEVASEYTPPHPATISGLITKHEDSTLSLYIQEHSGAVKPVVTESSFSPIAETIQLKLIPPTINYQYPIGVYESDNESVHSVESHELTTDSFNSILGPSIYFPPVQDLPRETSIHKSKQENSNSYPATTFEDIVNHPIVAKAEAPKLQPYSLVQEVREVPIKPASQKNSLQPYSLVQEVKEVPIKPISEKNKIYSLEIEAAKIDDNTKAKNAENRIHFPAETVEKTYSHTASIDQGVYFPPSPSPSSLQQTVENLPIIAIAEAPKLKPYSLVQEVKEVPIKPASEKNKLQPYSLVQEIKEVPIKPASEKNRLQPYSLVQEIKEVPIKPASEKNRLQPYSLVQEIKEVPIKPASKKNTLQPYSLVQEVKEVPIKPASEKNKIEPFAVETEHKDEEIQYKNVVSYGSRPVEQVDHTTRNVPYQVKAKPTYVRDEYHPPRGPPRPYALAAEKVNEPRIIPTRSQATLSPYSITGERTSLPLTSNAGSPAYPTYVDSKQQCAICPQPNQERQRVNPLSVSSRVVNRPIYPQSAEVKSPLAAVSGTRQRIQPPLRLSHKQSYGGSYGVIGENSYKDCLSNDECKQDEICEDGGRCTLACAIARNLCIGDARCETRHHVSACVCPLMSTAVTVTRSGTVQFDCMPMVMPPNDNQIRRSQTTQSSNRNRPYYSATSTTCFVRFQGSPLRPIAPVSSGFHSRPIVSSPIRGGSFNTIRDAAGPPAISPSFGGSSFGGSSFAVGGSGDACNPSPCGPNTKCTTNTNGIALCRCIEDYVPDGNTINGCKPQCVTDSDCPSDYLCRRQKCERVCARGACGHNADCDGRNHRAVCTCPSGYNGNPNVGGSCSPIAPIIRVPDDLPIDVCNPNPCGLNADCRERGDRPVCSCPRGYEGDPLTRCNKGECVEHNDCPNHLACQNLKCFDPCTGVCGSGSECSVRNHQPICSCPRNFIGDPFTSCRQLTEHDICNPTPCGLNTKCSVRHDRTSGSMRAVCSCIDNYLGNPLSECRPECVRDSDCNANQHCRENRCRNPCVDACGEGAYCDVRNNRAVCTCPEHFSGDPHSRCYPECTKHDDCPDYQACYLFKCIDPCQGACGTGADCKVEKHTPICSCPRGYTGDPFVSCRAFTLEDLCRDNPCGTNAECHPGKDRTGNDRPVCTCPRAYIGNPLVSCQRGECEGHNDCPDHQACYAYTCQSPCYTEVGSVCGTDADCKVRNHTPVCSCPRGYSGNPLTSCTVAPNARIAGRVLK